MELTIRVLDCGIDSDIGCQRKAPTVSYCGCSYGLELQRKGLRFMLEQEVELNMARWWFGLGERVNFDKNELLREEEREEMRGVGKYLRSMVS